MPVTVQNKTDNNESDKHGRKLQTKTIKTFD